MSLSRDPRRLVALAAAVSGLVLGGCRSGDLEGDLRETGLRLHLPVLAGNLPARSVDVLEPGVVDADPVPPEAGPAPRETARPTQVGVVWGVVTVEYTRDGRPAFVLTQQPAPQGPLCNAVPTAAGSDCTEVDGVLRAVMEEQATIALRRGSTLLLLRGLVIETHPDLVEAAIRALRRAPAVSAGDLAELDR